MGENERACATWREHALSDNKEAQSLPDYVRT